MIADTTIKNTQKCIVVSVFALQESKKQPNTFAENYRCISFIFIAARSLKSVIN